jgi:GTPase SAR1 family protein
MIDPIINLSLISHTNVGKTTLARTLLRKDIGEVFDQSHVTDEAEKHVLIQTGDGALLNLWDTPGFGDSFRLWKRLKVADQAVIRFLTQTWDRFTDRPFWCSQQAILNVRDQANVVLYLANAAEDPEEAAYIRPEMEILEWLNKPIVVLLNQMGQPKDRAHEESELDRWRRHFGKISNTTEVMAFDAFARCWVQEELLWRKIQSVLPRAYRPVMQECLEHSRGINIDRFRQTMDLLGTALHSVIRDREPLPPQNMAEKILSPVAESFREPQKQAMAKLGERMIRTMTAAVSEIIQVHELSGEAARIIEERFEDDFAVQQPASKGIAGTVGGFLSGALTGLAADLTAGGLTFGGGALIGGLLGVTGGVAAAEGFNLIRGQESSVAWTPKFVTGMVESTVLRYLAVAHFGRGRGDWTESEHPIFWKDIVAETTAPLQPLIESAVGRANDDDVSRITGILSRATAKTLQRLYPDVIPDELESGS